MEYNDYILGLYPETVTSYTCSCCGKRLPVKDFYNSKNTYQTKIKSSSQAKEVTSHCKQCIKDRMKKVSFEKYLWTSAKARSKRNGLDFDIEIEDVFVPQYCPVLGLELKRNDKGILPNSATLDRVDNSKGYIKGNIQVISYLANTMKNQATQEQLLLFADWVKSTYAQKFR